MKKIFFSVIIILVFFNFRINAEIIKKIKAPDFYLYNVNRKVVHLYSEKFKNAIVILNFFAEWCLSCKEEISYLEKLYQRYKNKNVVVIGVLLDSKFNYEKLSEFIKDNGISYPLVKGNKEVIEKYGGISVVPTTFILNHRKYINDKIIGIADFKKLSKEIDKLIVIRQAGSGLEF